MANLGFCEYIAKIGRTMQDRSLLAEVGFEVGHAVGDEHHPAIIEDQSIARSLLDLIRNLMCVELLSMLYYARRPPMVFSALLSKDPFERREALGFCEDLWASLLAAEELKSEDTWFAGYLRDLT